MATKPQKLNVPVTLSLRQETVEKLTTGLTTVSPADALASRCNQYLELVSDGAVLITPDEVSQIESNTRKQVNSSRDVVKASEGGHEVDDGQGCYKWRIDPAYLEPIKAMAEQAGRSVGEWIGDAMDWAWTNNWIADVSVPGMHRKFPQEQEDWLKQELGKDYFTVADLISHIKELKRGKKKHALRETDEVEELALS